MADHDFDVDNMDFSLPSAPSMTVKQSQSTATDMVMLYPVYIDAARKCPARRVPMGTAVADPSAIFMFESCRRLGFVCEFDQEKRHPKDALVFGRVRVALKLNGQPVIPSIPTKTVLMKRIAQMHDLIKSEMLAQDPNIARMAAHSRSEVEQITQIFEKTSITETSKSTKKKGKGKKK